MDKLKIAIIGTAGLPAQYGGFETLAENLVKNKTDGVEYTVFCSAKLYKEKPKNYLGAELRYINLEAHGVSSIFYDLVCMLCSLRADVMLILGVSASLFLPFIRFMYRGKIITNIDGNEWKRDKWNKFAKYILRASEKSAVRFSDIVIGDNQGIIDYVTETYKKSAELIEYGADHVTEIQENKQTEDIFYQKPYAVTVCRIEPENNIHVILEAFSRQKEMPLVIVGNWKSSKYGLNLLQKYLGLAHIRLLDPIFESKKINFLRSNALVYVHGHSAGGTNPSLVEAMYLGLPILAFNCVYNHYTTENQCIYWSDANELYQYITQYDKIVLDNMGRNMKSIANNRYCWDIIISRYETLYKNRKGKN